MFNLISTLLAVVMTLSLAIPVARLRTTAFDTVKAADAAKQMQEVNEAASQYVQANWQAVLANAPVGGAPAIIWPYMLQNTGFLPSGFYNANPWGQAYVVEAFQPTPNNLQVEVMTHGGNQIPPRVSQQTAAMVGQSGGYVPFGILHNPAYAQGAFGGWQQYVADNPYYSGPGHLVSMLYFNQGTMLSSQYLYRVGVPGHSEVNKMQVALDMAKNNVTGANAVGIGTEAPAASLDIEADAGPGGSQVVINNSTWGNPAGITLSNSAGGTGVKLGLNPTAPGSPLELRDSKTGTLQHYWQGNKYFSNGLITPNANGSMTYAAGQSCSGLAPAGAITSDAYGGILSCSYAGGAWTWQHPSRRLVPYAYLTYPAIQNNTWYWNNSGFDEIVTLTDGACGSCNLWLVATDSSGWLTTGYGNFSAGTYGDWTSNGQLTAVVPAGGYWEFGGGYAKQMIAAVTALE